LLLYSLFFHSYATLPDLHSFPTRRSSDLGPGRRMAQGKRIQRAKVARARDRGSNLVAAWTRVSMGRYLPNRQKGLDIVLHAVQRSEEHTSELQSRGHLVCRLLLEKKKKNN